MIWFLYLFQVFENMIERIFQEKIKESEGKIMETANLRFMIFIEFSLFISYHNFTYPIQNLRSVPIVSNLP